MDASRATSARDYVNDAMATGSCLCGAVRYEVDPPLRDVILCHCEMCRKAHGHIGAYTAAPKSALRVTESRGLKWYASSAIARRGFCGECGGTLFWEGNGPRHGFDRGRDARRRDRLATDAADPCRRRGRLLRSTSRIPEATRDAALKAASYSLPA